MLTHKCEALSFRPFLFPTKLCFAGDPFGGGIAYGERRSCGKRVILFSKPNKNNLYSRCNYICK